MNNKKNKDLSRKTVNIKIGEKEIKAYIFDVHESNQFDPSTLPYCTPSIKKSYQNYKKKYLKRNNLKYVLNLDQVSDSGAIKNYFNYVGKEMYDAIKKSRIQYGRGTDTISSRTSG